MLLVKPPGVYAPQGDSFLLREALLRVSLPPGAEVLDVCTGTGLIACAAARLGAARVRAIDTSATAVAAARCNARLRRLPAVRVTRGDFRRIPPAGCFDVITANPPYVPCPGTAQGGTRRARAWDAGHDGRLYLDRLCRMAPELLAASGVLLLVQSALSGPPATLGQLRAAGLKASVVARRRQPFGPVLRDRAAWLEQRGVIAPGQREEELVVIRADRVADTA